MRLSWTVVRDGTRRADLVTSTGNPLVSIHVASAEGGVEFDAILRLIRAAPELYDALEDLVRRCDGEEGVREDGSNIQTMRATIALTLAEDDDE